METAQRELQDLYDKAMKRLKEFEDDRYCPNGCIEYKLDKINMYKQYFREICESVMLIMSVLEVNPKAKNTQIYKELQKIQAICGAALDGTKWI